MYQKINIRDKEIELPEWDGVTPFNIGYAPDQYLYFVSEDDCTQAILALDADMSLIELEDDPGNTEMKYKPGKKPKKDKDGKIIRGRASKRWCKHAQCLNGYYKMTSGAGGSIGQIPDSFISEYMSLIEVLCNPEDFEVETEEFTQ